MMMKLTKIATMLLCTAAPVALFAQDVTLQSPDEFISVDGQIVGFNGVMLRVQTTVGAVSVPASEVICFGDGCLEIIASNDFGLTADAFQSIVTGSGAEVVSGSGDLQIAFAAPAFNTLYATAVGAFATSGARAQIAGDGTLTLQNDSDTATLTATDDAASANIVIETVSLNGTTPQAYANAFGWAGGGALTHQMVGLQSFSVLVAPNAGIDSISMNDLARVYAGEVTNWSQIGGADMNVLALQLPTSSPLRAQMEALVMAPAGKRIAGNVLTMSDEAGISASINQFPGSISIVSTRAADVDMTVPVAGSCGIAVAATPFNVKSGDYPLIRPVMATYDAPSNLALVTELFDFASTETVQDMLAGEGFVSHIASLQDSGLKNGRLSQLLGALLDDAQRVAAAEMFQVLFNADRMSPTLTGGAASGPEGAWNRAMMQDLIAALSDPANAGREIIFVGIGQSSADSQTAINASIAAAAEMQAALVATAPDVVAAGNYTLSSYGFGDVSPATCIDGQVAGPTYTRVEVWIR